MSVDANMSKGNIHRELSEFELAIQCYDRVLEKDPSMAQAYYLKARSL
jgi:tetratricopeptide (TPR) repeat protein